LAEAECQIYRRSEGTLFLSESVAEITGCALILRVYFFAERVGKCARTIWFEIISCSTLRADAITRGYTVWIRRS
jgi:hypothetical protein